MSLTDLAHRIDLVLSGQPWGDMGDDERKRALEACEKLMNRLETPFEKTLCILFSVMAVRHHLSTHDH